MSAGPASIAAWDARLLGNAVSTLGDVSDRLASWRARMEHVGRTLEVTECWSGDAGQAAAGMLVRLSTVTTEVTAALDASLDDAERMAADVSSAAEVAGRALVAAAAVPVTLDERGRPGPLPAVPLPPAADPAQALEQQQEAIVEQARAAGQAEELAADALRSADLAASAAADAVAALGRVGVVGGRVPDRFDDLLTAVYRGGIPPSPPPPGTASAVATWWAALGEEQREDWIEQRPELMGSLDGLPAWARDRANRLLLDRLVLDADAAGHDIALATAAEIASREDAGEQVQLYGFMPEDDLAALSVGDLDTADHIGVLVPGTGTTAADDLDAVMDDAAALSAAGAAAAPAAAVATLAWIGYRTPPSLMQAAESTEYARVGGPALDRTLDSLSAGRSVTGGRPHTAIFSHSYGSQVVEEAADAAGRLAADDVVMLGSPGIEGDAADLEVEDVFTAIGGSDPIQLVPLGSVLRTVPVVSSLVDSPVFGRPPWDPDYGATALPVTAGMEHSDYFDPDEPTLAAMGEVLVEER